MIGGLISLWRSRERRAVAVPVGPTSIAVPVPSLDLIRRLVDADPASWPVEDLLLAPFKEKSP